jgi:amidase
MEEQINLDRCAAWRPCVASALAAILATVSTPTMAGRAFNPANASIEQLRAALDAGRVSSEQLVAFYLDRIERFDKKGPRINALVSLNPKALEQARQSDAGKNKLRKGLLRGIPFIAKDNYNTAGIATSGGSAALKGSVPSANAPAKPNSSRNSSATFELYRLGSLKRWPS